MSISSLLGADSTGFQEMIKLFQQGKRNLQKADLTAFKGALEAPQKTPVQPVSPFEDLLNSFDEIDKNQDGISIQELSDFAQAKGVTASSDAANKSDQAGNNHRKSHLGKGEIRPVFMEQAKKDPQPVGLSDLAAYKDQLEKSGKSVPPVLQELIDNFAAIDGDQDGKINMAEFRVFDKKSGGGNPKASEGLSRDDLLAVKAQFEADSQGVLSNLNSLISSFGTADTNMDGKISAEEMMAFAKAQKASESLSGATVPSKEQSALDVFAFLSKTTKNNQNDENKKNGNHFGFFQKLLKNYEAFTSKGATGTVETFA